MSKPVTNLVTPQLPKYDFIVFKYPDREFNRKNLLQGTSSPSSTSKRSSTEQTQLPGTSSSYNTQTGLSHPTTRSTLLGDFYHPNIEDAISIQLSPEDLDFLTKLQQPNRCE